eukprot:TRINITY_DN19124_c0_g1_i1.p1 TRINITY_DN19124_c0_g1~~TRINITY_DN19124_c0_g1_i1.p1  ORF type:complete len:654 (+),score=79.89 TRINITY_DN19124_c0_g1_i1:98-1963(+)
MVLRDGDEPVFLVCPYELEEDVLVEVPKAAKPGVSMLSFSLGNQPTMFQVPQQAIGGDQLVFRKNGDTWSCVTIRRKQVTDVSSAISIFVPAWATPGETALDVEVSPNNMLSILVPPTARPGDKLLIKQISPTEGWQCATIKEVPTMSSDFNLERLSKSPQFRAAPIDAQSSFDELVAAIRDAGGFVSSKLIRGALPPLNIPGILASEAIAKGEELLRVPRRLHITMEAVERLAPQLCRKVEALPGMARDVGSADRAKMGAFVAAQLVGAENRAMKDCGEATSDSLLRFGVAEDQQSTQRVWNAYVDGLFGMDFDSHPFVRCTMDLKEFQANLQASPQAHLIPMMCAHIQDCHESLSSVCSEDTFVVPSLRMYLHARLSMATRCFRTTHLLTLVPCSDLFNHHVEEGVVWQWREEEDAMVVTATRAHEAGEEMFISYGRLSNALLYQAHGFTFHPRLEPSWCYQMKPESVHGICEEYLPEGVVGPHILLDSTRLDQSLTSLLKAASTHGQGSPSEFLALICARCKAAHDADERLQPALAALKRARAKLPGSHCWWEELEEKDRELAADDAVRIKMSEYLCLTAHLEAVDCHLGDLSAQLCLAAASSLRDLVSAALRAASPA